MSYNLLLVLLYGQSQSMGEEVFVGAISALFFSIIMWLFNKRKQKKDIEETTKQVQQDIVKEAKENVCLASSIEIDYSFLYKDLLDKCNPSNYMNPYDAKKVEISNSIYSQIEENKNNTTELIKLRNRAIKELNIKFSSEVLFEKLTQVFNPSNFINENYDAVKLYAANKIYSQILKYKDNIVELERIAIDNQINILVTCSKGSESIVVGKEKQSSEDNDITGYSILTIVFLLTLGIILYSLTLDKVNQLTKDVVVQEQIDNEDNYMQKFSSDKFSITYPPTWKKVLQNNSVGSNTTISLKIEENLNDENKPVSSINIIISNKKWNEPTSYLAKKSHEEIKKYDYKCNFISIDDCILSGYKGSVLKQTIVLNGFKYLQYQYIVKKEDNTTFIITVDMDNSNYELQENTIKEILSSLIIK